MREEPAEAITSFEPAARLTAQRCPTCPWWSPVPAVHYHGWTEVRTEVVELVLEDVAKELAQALEDALFCLDRYEESDTSPEVIAAAINHGIEVFDRHREVLGQGRFLADHEARMERARQPLS